MEERSELKLTRSVTLNPQNQLSTSLTGGVLGTQRLGSPTINAALLGQAIPFATPGKTDAWGGFGGLGLEWRWRNVSFFSAGEYLALSDKSNVISGRAGRVAGQACVWSASTSCTNTRSCSAEKGLGKKASAMTPVGGRWTDSSLVSPLMAMTLMSARRLRIIRISSAPLMLGMRKSVTTRAISLA